MSREPRVKLASASRLARVALSTVEAHSAFAKVLAYGKLDPSSSLK